MTRYNKLRTDHVDQNAPLRLPIAVALALPDLSKTASVRVQFNWLDGERRRSMEIFWPRKTVKKNAVLGQRQMSGR
jgi:hypothetical protein